MYSFVVLILLILNITKLLKSQNVENGCWPYSVVSFDLDTTFGMVTYISFRILNCSS